MSSCISPFPPCDINETSMHDMCEPLKGSHVQDVVFGKS